MATIAKEDMELVQQCDFKLIAVKRLSYAVFFALVWSALLAYMAYDLWDQLFDFKNHTANTLIFIFMSSVGIVFWLGVADRKPQLIITSSGLSMRSNSIPFFPMKFIRWDNVNYYHLREVNDRNTNTLYLVVRKKDKENDVKLELTGLDKSMSDVIHAIRKYAEQYNFTELSKDYD